MDTLFGSNSRTDVLVAVGRLGETYVAELGRLLGLRPTEVVRALSSLERSGVVATKRLGNTRVVRLEPRYRAKDELYALLLRLGESPRYAGLWSKVRGRPRAIGKPL
jgi:DNA-binding transcriptional ArsR family regulator